MTQHTIVDRIIISGLSQEVGFVERRKLSCAIRDAVSSCDNVHSFDQQGPSVKLDNSDVFLGNQSVVSVDIMVVSTISDITRYKLSALVEDTVKHWVGIWKIEVNLMKPKVRISDAG